MVKARRGLHGVLQRVYCGNAMAPVNCNGCGRFLTLSEIHENESRCDDCM